MKKIILIIFCITLIGCAEEKGNYNYWDLNEVSISLNKITEDGSGTDVMHNEQFKIEPQLKRTLETTEDDLSFEWTINGEQISTDRNLDIIIPEKWTFGQKTGRFAVTVKSTGMKYFSPFTFNIVNMFGLGHYILCRQSDNSSMLYYLKEVIETVTDENDKPTGEIIVKEPVIIPTTMIGDLEIGDYPMDLFSSYGRNEDLGAETWVMNVLTKEGKHNLIKTNLIDFFPMMYVGTESFADMSKDYKFNPSTVQMTGRNDIIYLSNGQIIKQVENKLYRPSKLYPEYNFSKIYIGNPSMTLFGYDDNTKKCYYLELSKDDSNAYDIASLPENAPDYSGKNIVGFAFNSYATPDYLESEEYIYCAVTENDEIIIDKYTYSEKIAPDWSDVTYKQFYTPLYSLQIPNANEKTKVLLFDKDWYISNNNTIYISSFDIPDAQPFYTIPAELGEITDIRLSTKRDKLTIACYNSQSSEEKKGSLIVMTLQTKKTNIYKFFMDEPVALNCCDDKPW